MNELFSVSDCIEKDKWIEFVYNHPYGNIAVVIKEMAGILGSFSTRSIIQGGPLFIENENGIKAVKVLIEQYDKIAQKKALALYSDSIYVEYIKHFKFYK